MNEQLIKCDWCTAPAVVHLCLDHSQEALDETAQQIEDLERRIAALEAERDAMQEQQRAEIRTRDNAMTRTTEALFNVQNERDAIRAERDAAVGNAESWKSWGEEMKARWLGEENERDAIRAERDDLARRLAEYEADDLALCRALEWRIAQKDDPTHTPGGLTPLSAPDSDDELAPFGWLPGSTAQRQTRTVRIPAMTEHKGQYTMNVTLNWVCPVCGGPRGEPFETISFDGSLRLSVQGWVNPCGHIDTYHDVRSEAAGSTARSGAHAPTE